MSNQNIMKLNTSQLGAKADFQRIVDKKRVAQIAKNWDYAKMRVPCVADIDGTYYVWDGQHTIAALKLLAGGDCDVLCQVSKMTYEEAALHVKEQYDNIKRLTVLDVFKAGLEAGDTDDVNIQRVLFRNGIKVSSSCSVNTTSSITTLKKINKQSTDMLNTTLELIKNTWTEDENRYKGEFIDAVYRIVSTYGRDLDKKMFIRKLSVKSVGYYIQYGRELRVSPTSKAIAYSLLDKYNTHLSTRRLDKSKL